MSTPASGQLSAGGHRRPPVEHRLLGLDRRTFKLPLIAVAVTLLWTVVSPAVNDAVDYDDPVRAGDALIIGPSATMAPPAGWGVESGIRTTDRVRAEDSNNARVALSGDGVSVTTLTGPFAGDARALVQQVTENDEQLAADSAFTVEGEPRTLTVDGRRGVAQQFKTLTGEGAIFGFVENGVGIDLIVSGPTTTLSRQATKIGQMIASIDFDAPGSP